MSQGLLLLLLSHFSHVQLCATPEMAAHQAPPSLGFSRQEHWSGLPFPSPMRESEMWKRSCSVVSDSSRPHGLQPARLLRPWDFPGKSTGVGCHCLLLSQGQGYKIQGFILVCLSWERNLLNGVPPNKLNLRETLTLCVKSLWDFRTGLLSQTSSALYGSCF